MLCAREKNNNNNVRVCLCAICKILKFETLTSCAHFFNKAQNEPWKLECVADQIDCHRAVEVLALGLHCDINGSACVL